MKQKSKSAFNKPDAFHSLLYHLSFRDTCLIKKASGTL